MTTSLFRQVAIGFFSFGLTAAMVAATATPAYAQTGETPQGCAAPAPKHHGLHLGGLLRGVQQAGAMGALGPLGMVAGRGGAILNVAASVAASGASRAAARNVEMPMNAEAAPAAAACADQAR